jgi:hypothetical protein
MTVPASQPTYRAFLVNAAGRIYFAHVLDCETDEQAIAAAQKYVDGTGVQLWDRSRKIAEFPPVKRTERPHSIR